MIATAGTSAVSAAGSCAQIDWTLFGLSMPAWALAWFLGLGIITLWFTYRKV